MASVREEIEGLTEAQAIRHLALTVDSMSAEMAKMRGLLTQIGLLLFGSMVSLSGVFLAVILR